MQTLIKPNRLNPGDTVAAITLSWGGAGLFTYRYEMGKKRLEEVFNLNIVPTKFALRSPEWIYKYPKARADDLMEAFSNPKYKAIFCMIGGEDSVRILPLVDLSVIRNNPKAFVGFSDNTVTHFMCMKAGVGSFYGPSIMTSFAENVEMHRFTVEGVKKTLFSPEVIGEIPQNKSGWTVEWLDWANPSNQKVARSLSKDNPRRFINGTQAVKGRLIGGCVEVIQLLNGTTIWPDLSIWKDAILFLETSEEGMPPILLERMLRNLGAQGILKQINAILLSKPGGASLDPAKFGEYDQAILKVINEFDRTDMAVVTNMDFGHTDPFWTMPYGILTEVDPANQKVRILEGAVV